MLRQFNRLAREMLFLHGHLTRPADWAQSAAPDTTGGGRRIEKSAVKRSRGRRFATIAAACAVVTPLRFVSGQLR
jgi:hypothetical protein